MKIMITLNHFTEKIKKYNTIKHLKNVIKKVNNGEGYCSLIGNHVVFNKYLTGYPKKIRDKFIEDTEKGITSFDLYPKFN